MSWPVVKLEDFCRTGSGTTPSRGNPDYYGGGIPWVKSGELRETTILATEETVTALAVENTALKIAPAGALLVAMYGATVGRVGELGISATTNQAICHVVPDPQCADQRYMFHILQANAAYLVSQAVGGAQPNISQGVIRSLKIPLPPLPEQKRIAAILDQADALRRLRAAALEKVNTLGQVIFQEMFGDLDKGHVKFSRLGSYVESARIGLVRGAVEQNDDFDTDYLRMDSIGSNGALSFAGLRRVQTTAEDRSLYSLQVGDFLFNTRNSRELVGKSAVVRSPFAGVYNNNIMRLRFSDGLSPFFLDYYLRTRSGQSALENIKSGTTNVFAIYQGSLMELGVPVAEVAQQKKFEAALSSIENYLLPQMCASDRANALFASLQHRAFQGEL